MGRESEEAGICAAEHQNTHTQSSRNLHRSTLSVQLSINLHVDETPQGHKGKFLAKE